MSELRQRSSGATPTNSTMNDEDDDYSGGSLSAPTLLNASPTHHGTALKLHIPFFYGLCPSAVRRLIYYIENYWSCCAPEWKERHLIILGSYFYRYKNEHSSSPKGSPLRLEAIDTHVVDESEFEDDGLEIPLSNLPPGCNAIFSVTTFGKKRYFAVSTREEALTWVNSLREARQEAITRTMGHSKVPTPSSWTRLDDLAASLVKSKERVKRRMEEMDQRDMEMTRLGGGQSAQGFYR